ncbi:MAG: zf-HC2 domain-containing protein [Acidobacteria bacterium]|nr:zf-HC2 domain-containing protein [Acidobacteriota bacterium]MBI3664202.1 zf-HC2 domain-containing protein [Acidobacteriota bacterium]
MGHTATLSCSEVRRQLPAYLNGMVDTETAQQLRWHFGQCQNCRLVVRTALNTLSQHFMRHPAETCEEKTHAT